jgi:hypothetical protein
MYVITWITPTGRPAFDGCDVEMPPYFASTFNGEGCFGW